LPSSLRPRRSSATKARAGGLLAGGLAYRIFPWQIPLALLLISALGLVSELVGSDPADLARQAGMTAALAATIAQGVAASEHGRLWFLLLGAFLTVWAGREVFRGSRLVSQLSHAHVRPVAAAQSRRAVDRDRARSRAARRWVRLLGIAASTYFDTGSTSPVTSTSRSGSRSS